MNRFLSISVLVFQVILLKPLDVYSQSHLRRILFPGNFESPEVEDIFEDREKSGRSENFLSEEISSNLVSSPLPSKCGDPLTLGAQPWIARLIYRTESQLQVKCLGVLISNRYVLTSSSCLSPGLNLIKIVLGDKRWHSREKMTETGATSCSRPLLEVGVEGIQTFSPEINDIGLIRLDREIVFETIETCNIQPICLPPEVSNESLIGQGNLVGAGWTSFATTQAQNIVQSFGVPLLDQKQCSEAYGQNFSSEKHICVRDACLLPGSPIIWPGHVMKLFALATASETPCNPGRMPAMYLSIEFYRDWIVNNMFP